MGQWIKALQLTDEKLEKIEECLNKGMFESHTMPLVDVAESTWYKWKRDARSLREELENETKLESELESDDIKLLKFLMICEKGRSTAISENLKNIVDAGKIEWRASAWYLERVDNSKFGNKQNVAVSGSLGIHDVDLTEEESKQFKKNMASIGLGDQNEE